MNLNIDKWKEFRFGDLITDIYKAKAINKDDITIASDLEYAIRYITRTGDNNGCEILADIRDINPEAIEKGNAVSIGDTTATCFYQNEKFIAGDHMVVVRADNWLNQYTALFIVTLLNNEQFKYSYGRAFLMDRIKNTIVKLPTDKDGNPDWKQIETYIKMQNYKCLTTKNKTGQVPNLDTNSWKSFYLTDIFTRIEPGKINNASDLEEGKELPYLGAKKDNNGVMQICKNIRNKKSDGNCVVMICDGEGSVGLANYMESDFLGTVNLMLGYNEKHLNKYVGLFLATVLSQERPKYSFGRKWKPHISETIIKLPADTKGNPDWKFMENFIKALPYGDRI